MGRTASEYAITAVYSNWNYTYSAYSMNNLFVASYAFLFPSLKIKLSAYSSNWFLLIVT